MSDSGSAAPTPTSSPEQSVNPGGMRRVIVGVSLGQAIEWYDYAIYGYLAGSIGVTFFPAEDKTATMLAAYAAFAVSFFIRPLGGMLFGSIGDRLGRKNTLAAILLLIGGSTFAIGVLPGYATIGIAAPLLLIALRLLQGLSAGGELAGATAFLAEHSPDHKRGFLLGFSQVGASLGPLIGASLVAALTSSMGPTVVDQWVWRVPFLLAGPVAVVGLYVRLRLEESPIFREVLAAGHRPKAPLRSAFRQHGWGLARCTGVAVTHMIPYYLILTYLPNQLKETGQLPGGSAYLATTLALIAQILVTPIAAALTDRFGRRPVAATAAFAYAILAFPIFMGMNTAGTAVVLLCQIGLGIIFGIYTGSVFPLMVEMFPTQARYTSMAIGYNVAAAAFGGTAPLIATTLVATTGNVSSPAFYLIGGAVLSLICIAKSRETARTSLSAA
ncbi:MFS transporter [Pseudonocardia sp. C8]|uniref:MFS transporter n=1 Tax=Pseudonocardia sp. C8 TaxID=2762759 RepID=UPI001642AE1C|nr:MFS transporter [Pseudonocardia sp. C8]MBC3189540.1 MFS transporter [Pseudonocardia sp. C8]